MISHWFLGGLFALSSLSMLNHPAAALDLVKDGQPAATIVLPAATEYDKLMKEQAATLQPWSKSVGDEELLAANELQSIIEKISGARLPIVRSENGQLPAGTTLLVGAELARSSGVGADLDKLQKDGLLARVKGDSLVLSGRRARGTLYAAYDFLESLGCRWVMPGSFGEMYPSLKTISTTIDKAENPGHTERYFWCTFGNTKEYGLWTLRNKGNFIKTLGDPTITQSHALAAPLRWGARQDKYRVHGVMETVDVKKKGPDGKEVVEKVEREKMVLPDDYYALVDGKVWMTTPDFSNPKVWDMYGDYFIDLFTRNPWQEYASLSAEDGLVLDEHPESMKLASGEYDWTIGAPSATDQLWFFHNQVISRVTKVFPDKKFGVLVYANNTMPPRKNKVHKNMALVFAPLDICPLHRVGDPQCKTNKPYKEWLDEWMRLAREAGAESYYYDYEPTGFSWNVAMICPRWGIIGKNYPYFKQLGLTGHTSQGHDDWGACGLDNYLMQRLYWNPNQPYKEIIADYCRARFGAAAPVMRDYYDLLEKRMDETPDLYCNEVWSNHLVLTPAVRKAAREVLARAVQQADSERARAQVQAMVDLQTSTDAMCDGIEYADETGDFGQGAKLIEPVFAIADKLNKIYPNYMQPKRIDRNSKNFYLTGGIYNLFLQLDAKIKGSAASLPLPRYWTGRRDDDGKAIAQGYEKPDAVTTGLDDLDTTVLPDVKYNSSTEPASFFYRTEVQVPAEFNGKKTTLFFSSLIAQGLQIWINGQPVEFQQGDRKDTAWQGPAHFWVSYDHRQEFDVTPWLKPGQKNTIALRITKKHEIAGTYHRIFLLGN